MRAVNEPKLKRAPTDITGASSDYSDRQTVTGKSPNHINLLPVINHVVVRTPHTSQTLEVVTIARFEYLWGIVAASSTTRKSEGEQVYPPPSRYFTWHFVCAYNQGVSPPHPSLQVFHLVFCVCLLRWPRVSFSVWHVPRLIPTRPLVTVAARTVSLQCGGSHSPTLLLSLQLFPGIWVVRTTLAVYYNLLYYATYARMSRVVVSKNVRIQFELWECQSLCSMTESVSFWSLKLWHGRQV